MSSHRARLAVPFVLLVLVIALASCAERGDPFEGRSVLHRGMPADPESLDPQRARSTQATDVLRDIGEGLLGYSAAGELVPASAESWTISDDGLVYRLTLREGLLWSSGDPVTADHFVLGLRRLVDPATAAFYAAEVDMIEGAAAIIASESPAEELGVTAPDERTVEIRLARPTPYMLYLLAHPSTFPVNPAALEQHGDAFTRPGNLPSNGAYVLEEWGAGSVMTLVRNEQYWNASNVAIDVVRYHITAQDMTELNRYRAGELDITSTVPPEAFEQVADEYPDELRVAPLLGVYYYAFNLTRPPFKDNPKLRQALSMAVDRDLLVEKVTARGELPAYSWVPPGVDNYTPPQLSFAKLTQAERNSIAKSLYQQAGYSEDNPASIELRYNTSDTQRRIALAVQAMWSEVLGVETTLINEEFQVLLQNMREREVTQVVRASWLGDYTDAVTFLGILQPGASSNVPGYENAEYAELLDAAARQTDMQARRLYLEEAERVMLRDHPVLPLYFYVSKQLVSPKVRGWQDNLLNYHYSQHLSLDETGD